MGCCGSTSEKETVDRLDNLEQNIRDVTSTTGTEGLSAMGGCAKELSEVFKAVVDAGAKDMASITRIEDLSDLIVRNLVARITTELVQKGPAEYQPLVDAIMKVATDLDAVRATKATTLVDKQLKHEVDQHNAALEKSAQPLIAKMKQIHEKLKAPGQEKHLVPGSKDILDLAEKAHEAAPDSKLVFAAIMEPLQAHAVWILQVEDSWCTTLEMCQAVIDVSKRIDEIATKLVAALGAIWEPPIAPQVEHMKNAKADRVCAELLAEADKCLAADEGGGAYDYLVALLPWWPALKDSHSLEVVGIFSKLQTYASDSFLKAAKAGHTSTAEDIRGFAAQFDELRGKYVSLPPTASARPLGEVLEVGEATVQVLKAFDAVDAEIAKTKDDDKSTNLSLATTIQALESLVVAWPTATRSAPDELIERLNASSSSLEAWTEETAAACPSAKLAGLLKFAAEYDSRRGKIEPCATAGPLKPRIASIAALTYLKTAQAELSKTEGMKPNVLLDGLKAAAEAIPGESGSEEARTRLREVFTATDERLLKSFVDLIASGEENEKKEVMLLQFAKSADDIRSSCSVASEDGTSLADRMQQKRVELGEEHLSKLEEQLKAAAGPDFKAVEQSLLALRPISKKLDDGTHQERLQAVCSGLADPLVQAVTEATTYTDADVADGLLQSAHGMDKALAALGFEDAGLSAKIGEQVVQVHLAVAEKGKSDCSVLGRELGTLEKLCRAESCSPEVLAQIRNFVESLEQPLLDQLLKAGSGSAEPVLAAAAAADKAHAAAGGSEAADVLSSKVSGAQAVARKLEEAQAELAKPSGMNPKIVVTALKDLEALWAPVASLASSTSSVQVIVGQFKEKLIDASQKAFEADEAVRDKKLQGVQMLASDADTSQQALVALSTGRLEMDSFAQAVARVVVDKQLAAAEAELAKPSGMNSAALLKSIQHIGKELPNVGSPTADDAAFDEVEALKARWSEACERVSSRMQESMDDAVKTSNAAKQKALVKFAQDFDAACNGLCETSLEAQLKTKLDSCGDKV